MFFHYYDYKILSTNIFLVIKMSHEKYEKYEKYINGDSIDKTEGVRSSLSELIENEEDIEQIFDHYYAFRDENRGLIEDTKVENLNLLIGLLSEQFLLNQMFTRTIKKDGTYEYKAIYKRIVIDVYRNVIVQDQEKNQIGEIDFVIKYADKKFIIGEIKTKFHDRFLVRKNINKCINKLTGHEQISFLFTCVNGVNTIQLDSSAENRVTAYYKLYKVDLCFVPIWTQWTSSDYDKKLAEEIFKNMKTCEISPKNIIKIAKKPNFTLGRTVSSELGTHSIIDRLGKKRVHEETETVVEEPVQKKTRKSILLRLAPRDGKSGGRSKRQKNGKSIRRSRLQKNLRSIRRCRRSRRQKNGKSGRRSRRQKNGKSIRLSKTTKKANVK